MAQVKKTKKMNFFVKIAFVVFGIFCAFTIYSMQTQIGEMQKKKSDLDAKIAVYEAKVAELNDNLSETYDNEYVMKVAREKLEYSLPGEIIFYNDLTQ